ncbi:family 16 glycosylhydrolase, partial [Actibacterium sp. 188UL27-1]|nr:family 16 glycosylhydrolase [Actibacterium sp. 188UL27-1]
MIALSMCGLLLMLQNLNDSFTDNDLDPNTWRISDFAINANFIDTAWSPDNVTVDPSATLPDGAGGVADTGALTLTLDTDNSRGKRFTGAEVDTDEFFSYGRYEVTMTPSAARGVNSTFFMFTGAPFGDSRSEIDFEFLGSDTTQVLLTYHTSKGSDGEFVDLGFDAAAGPNTYAFEWGPDSISWYANGVLLRSIQDPELAVPSDPGRIFMSIWTGNSNDFTGVPNFQGETSATYYSVSFEGRTAPIALNDIAFNPGSGPITVDVLANDSAPIGTLEAGSVAITAAPANGSVSVNAQTGQVEYTPDFGFRGVDTFSYSVANADGEISNFGEATVATGFAVFDDFTSGAGSFSYFDDAFRGTSEPGFADGLAADGVLRVTLGGGNTKSTIS